MNEIKRKITFVLSKFVHFIMEILKLIPWNNVENIILMFLNDGCRSLVTEPNLIFIRQIKF